jgi:hypothetical protein
MMMIFVCEGMSTQTDINLTVAIAGKKRLLLPTRFPHPSSVLFRIRTRIPLYALSRWRQDVTQTLY